MVIVFSYISHSDWCVGLFHGFHLRSSVAFDVDFFLGLICEMSLSIFCPFVDWALGVGF